MCVCVCVCVTLYDWSVSCADIVDIRHRTSVSQSDSYTPHCPAYYRRASDVNVVTRTACLSIKKYLPTSKVDCATAEWSRGRWRIINAANIDCAALSSLLWSLRRLVWCTYVVLTGYSPCMSICTDDQRQPRRPVVDAGRMVCRKRLCNGGPSVRLSVPSIFMDWSAEYSTPRGVTQPSAPPRHFLRSGPLPSDLK